MSVYYFAGERRSIEIPEDEISEDTSPKRFGFLVTSVIDGDWRLTLKTIALEDLASRLVLRAAWRDSDCLADCSRALTAINAINMICTRRKNIETLLCRILQPIC